MSSLIVCREDGNKVSDLCENFFLGASRAYVSCLFCLILQRWNYQHRSQRLQTEHSQTFFASLFHKCKISHFRCHSHSAAAVSKHSLDLRDRTGCHCLADIKFAEAVRASMLSWSLKPAQSTSPIMGAPIFHGHMIELLDLLCVHFADGSAHYRRVLTVHIDESAIDRAITGNNTICRVS